MLMRYCEKLQVYKLGDYQTPKGKKKSKKNIWKEIGDHIYAVMNELL